MYCKLYLNEVAEAKTPLLFKYEKQSGIQDKIPPHIPPDPHIYPPTHTPAHTHPIYRHPPIHTHTPIYLQTHTRTHTPHTPPPTHTPLSRDTPRPNRGLLLDFCGPSTGILLKIQAIENVVVNPSREKADEMFSNYVTICILRSLRCFSLAKHQTPTTMIGEETGLDEPEPRHSYLRGWV